jgi:hypothetical protein
MVGTTLAEIREHVEALASPDGTYYLVCGRTGDRPVPATRLRFTSRPTARTAARATERYRAALRRYDPQLPNYDLIVCQAAESLPSPNGADDHAREEDRWTLSEPVVNGSASEPERRCLVEFCHRVAAAVFETLVDAGYESVETAVMDAYFDHAETVADPDDLCLRLLESMASVLQTELPPAEQADVLARAATRLPRAEADDDPVATTFTRLQQLGLVESYARSPWSVDLDDGTRSVVVRLDEYALSPRDGRLPVLPVVLDLYRRRSEWPPSALAVTDIGDGWRITLEFAREPDPDGLVNASIESEA